MSSENDFETSPAVNENNTNINICEESTQKSANASSPHLVVKSYSYSRKLVDGKIVEKRSGVKRVDNDWFIINENGDWTPSSEKEALSASKIVKTLENAPMGEGSEDKEKATPKDAQPEKAKSKKIRKEESWDSTDEISEEDLLDVNLLGALYLLSRLTWSPPRRRRLFPLSRLTPLGFY